MDSRQNIIHDQVTSRLRTHVPILVGSLVTYIRVKLGFTFDAETEAALIAFTVGASISLYYELVRFLEAKFPSLGWLLGMKGEPKYSGTTKRLI